MFIKSFITIFLVLFYFHLVLPIKIVPDSWATMWYKATCMLLSWVLHAMIGATIVSVLYQIWN